MTHTGVTLRDVARAAGVSLGTASRALSGRGSASAKAITAVTDAADRLGYMAEASGQALRPGSSGVIGLLVSDLSSPFYTKLIHAMEGRLQQAGYALLVCNTRNDARREKALITMLRRRRVDALAIAWCECENPDLLEQLALSGMPVVSLDREFGPRVSSVHVDHYLGSLQAARHLLQMGHQRIAFVTMGHPIGENRTLRPGRERLAGFEAAFTEIGLQPDPALVVPLIDSPDLAFERARQLLALPDPPTAFLCMGSRMMGGVLSALRQAGKRIPQDISLISVGDFELASLWVPGLTSVGWDLRGVGTGLGNLLIKQLASATPVMPERVVLSTYLVLRESCAPPRHPTSDMQGISG